MKKPIKILSYILATVLIALSMSAGLTQPVSAAGTAWTGTWSTSPVPINLVDSGSSWMNVINAAIKLLGGNPESSTEKTIRIVVKSTIAGDQVRFTLSNKYGTSPITIQSVELAKTSTSEAKNIVKGSNKPITFHGSATVTIPAGGSVVCDPVSMNVSAMENLTITYCLKTPLVQISTGGMIGAKTYFALENRVSSEKFPTLSAGLYANDGSFEIVPLLTNVDVFANNASAIVIVGDSTVNNNVPLLFAQTLNSYGVKKHSVVQQTIMGNRLIYDGTGSTAKYYGQSLLNRFQSDVLSISGVKHVFVKIGTADVAHPLVSSLNTPYASTNEIISGYKQLINMAHAKGVKIYFMTVTPWNGYKKGTFRIGETTLVWNSDAKAMCDELNQWIRSNNGSDGYVDLSALSNSIDATKIKSDYSSDGLNLNKKGQQAVVNAIPLSIFGIKVPTTTASPGSSHATTRPQGGSGTGSYTNYPGSGSYVYNPTQAVIGDGEYTGEQTGEYADPPTTLNYNGAIPIDVEANGVDGLSIALRASKVVSAVVAIVMVACVILLIMLNKKKELV